ncbi:MAG: hypothetical protein ACRD96_22285, partial [Bryobacteraceae bacterium]
MRPVSILGVLAIIPLAFAAELTGIAPRPSRGLYDVTCFTESLAVAATLVDGHRAARLFGPIAGRNYVVVEVGFYSKNRSQFEVRPGDFALRVKPSRALIRPASPEAAFLSRQSLPAAATSRALAGYLFFPASDET